MPSDEKITHASPPAEPPQHHFFHDAVLGGRLLLYTIWLLLVIFFSWAYWAELDERTQAVGKVIPSLRVQKIQNLEGGILKKIFVREGDIVKKDQVLMQIDDTRFLSDYHGQQAKYFGLVARKQRLLAEVSDKSEVIFPPALMAAYPGIVAQEKRLFKTNRDDLETALGTLQTSFDLAKKELDLTAPLAKQKLVPQVKFLRLEREVNEMRGKLNKLKEDYLAKRTADLAEAEADIRALGETLAALKDRKNRTTVRSPVHGIVKKINIDTIGGVIQPGGDIMEIVPLDKQLLVEGKIDPSKIAFIKPGQPAMVRVSAYDATIYGSLKAKVVRVSADALVEKNQQGGSQTVYRVIVKTDKNYLMYRGKKLPIIPGMQATASILTGKKTVLNYLLKPILKAKQNALHER